MRVARVDFASGTVIYTTDGWSDRQVLKESTSDHWGMVAGIAEEAGGGAEADQRGRRADADDGGEAAAGRALRGRAAQLHRERWGCQHQHNTPRLQKEEGQAEPQALPLPGGRCSAAFADLDTACAAHHGRNVFRAL